MPEAEGVAAARPLGALVRWAKLRKHLIAVVLVAVAGFFTRSWEGDLHGDPVRYAAISKTILQTGDWVTMHDAPGVVYANKPPLMFWLVAVNFRLFGVGIYAAKFWSCFFAAAGCVMTYLIGKRLFGTTAGMLAAVTLTMTPGVLMNVIDVRMDSTILFCVALSAYAVLRADDESQPRWLLLAGVAAGLGVMTKSAAGGLAGILTFLLVLIRRPRWLIHPYAFGAVGLGLLIAAPWHVAVLLRQRAAFTEHYFGEQIEDRLVLGSHIPANIGRYVATFLLRSMPWCLLGAWTLARWRRFGRAERWGATIALVWAAEVILLMAIAPKPYDRYLVPAYPAVALLAGLGLDRLLSERVKAAAPAVLAYGAVAGVFLLATLPIRVHTYRCEGFAHARPLLDQVAPGRSIATCSSLTPGESEGDRVPWGLCAKAGFYLDRAVVSYRSPRKLWESSECFAVVREEALKDLAEVGFEPVLALDGSYWLIQRRPTAGDGTPGRPPLPPP
ncbi:MAG TPA: glycosyltransferase family 39 protein [Planctomycetota bacterium]|nr:glycosyltransferase family 39 protein [Planctomycetota bacterium]